jgi:glucosyl-dolichyl phosphate glucuronosyltransferase
MALDISVIICAYTEERWYELVAAVESIHRQTISPREIVVVIDHNTQLFERARTYIPDVSVIESSEPKGLSGARNSGIAVAKGSLIAFLDDDAIAEPDWLERLGDCCRNPEVLGAGGVVEPLWASKRPLWFPREFYWVIGCSYQDQLSAVQVVRNPYGGCTCIRREVFETVGGFRDGIGRVGSHLLGGEETELCIRAAQHWPHKVFLCDPQSRIHHHVSPQRASWRYFRSRCYAEGLSKAIVSRYVGVKDSLSSERRYTYYMLPRGIIQGITNAVLHRELAGLLQAGAIITGFVITTLGFLVGTFSQRIVSGQRMSSGINSPLQTLPTHE